MLAKLKTVKVSITVTDFMACLKKVNITFFRLAAGSCGWLTGDLYNLI